MNTSPSATKVLSYGDSNTYGQKPDKSGRYGSNVRWTGVLQDLLGGNYYVIEEGLNSRTTDLEYRKKPGRNGRTYLTPCLHSHNPIDIVTIMLGTNDLKIEYHRSAEDIALALGRLVDDVHAHSVTRTDAQPQVILISPIEIDDQSPRFTEFYAGQYDTESMIKSKKLSEAIKKIAAQKGVHFVDAANVSKPGEDGVHFSQESELPLAELVANVIMAISR